MTNDNIALEIHLCVVNGHFNVLPTDLNGLYLQSGMKECGEFMLSSFGKNIM